jgi:TctA family transporter
MLKLKGESRWKLVYEACAGTTRCGEDIEDGCGARQPNKYKEEPVHRIFAEWKDLALPEGVIAPDATMGANEGGGLMPTLAFGIPGGESMAILLVAFIGLGIVPGPDMLTKNLDVVFSMVWIIVFANIAVTIIGLGITPWLARLPSLQANLMVPMVLSVCFVGAYATRGRIEDVVVAAVFGVVGYLMDKYRYSRANFVIGMVLAVMIERNLHISINLYGADFLLDRPIALAMLIFVVVTAALPFWRERRRKRAALQAGGTA